MVNAVFKLDTMGRLRSPFAIFGPLVDGSSSCSAPYAVPDVLYYACAEMPSVEFDAPPELARSQQIRALLQNTEYQVCARLGGSWHRARIILQNTEYQVCARVGGRECEFRTWGL